MKTQVLQDWKMPDNLAAATSFCLFLAILITQTSSALTLGPAPKPGPIDVFPSGAYASLTQGVSSFVGGNGSQRTYMQTTDFSHYLAHSFVVEATVTVPAGSDPSGTAFFGLGNAKANQGFWGEPYQDRNIYARAAPSSFARGFFSVTNNKVENIGIVDHAAGDGRHRLRLSWNVASQTLRFSIHRQYSGGHFFANATVVTDPNGAGFLDSSPQLFWGGASGVRFEDFKMTAGTSEEGLWPNSVLQPLAVRIFDDPQNTGNGFSIDYHDINPTAPHYLLRPTIVYRGEGRASPTIPQVLTLGIQPPGHGYEIARHIRSNTERGYFVSTTFSQLTADEWAHNEGRNRHPVRYEICAGDAFDPNTATGIDATITLETHQELLDNPAPLNLARGSQEVLLVGYVAPRFIKGAYNLNTHVYTANILYSGGCEPGRAPPEPPTIPVPIGDRDRDPIGNPVYGPGTYRYDQSCTRDATHTVLRNAAVGGGVGVAAGAVSGCALASSADILSYFFPPAKLADCLVGAIVGGLGGGTLGAGASAGITEKLNDNDCLLGGPAYE